MRTLIQTLFFFLLVTQLCFAQLNQENNEPSKFLIKSHDPNLKSFPEKSFYKQKADWQHIIDSTWGQGVPLASKLAIFDAFAASISNEFDGFLSLGLTWESWDSLKSHFRSRIDSTTSRGIFASIMSQFAISLRDAHTWAWDTVVMYTPLSPGVPLLVLYPFATAEHFGAVLTALPDSTALVLRTIPNHPLGLQPGDIVLGYEGVPWKILVHELIDAELPVFSTGVGAASAEINSLIRNVGNNWHLFNTIDILKHSTQDTLHLSVQPLLTLPPDPMMGNEQLEIPGIPFSFYRGWPWEPTGQLLAFGMLPSANVGYIRLLGEWPSNAADPLFAAAIDSLWEAEGLIIDMRWNSGGWSQFNQAFERMFSEQLFTCMDALRANSSTFNLIPMGNADDAFIPGIPGSIYDRPIAVLLGPTCVSLGDWTAQRLRYHPMVRFFGKSSIASLGFSKNVTGWAGWWLRHSITDVYHMSQPEVYLNRLEFPIDETVWFNPDEVAQGIDPIIEHALNWIFTLSYAHDVVLSKDTVGNTADSIFITTKVTNPENHVLIVSAIITNEQGTPVDTTFLLPVSGDSLWGSYFKIPSVNGTYYVSVKTEDITSGTYRNLPDVALFTVIITNVEDLAGTLPHSFELQQNYPNPFNPSTKIKYSVPKTSQVQIKIYDVLGNEIETLVNKEKPAGTYELTWNAASLPSGVYFYQLKATPSGGQAGSFIEMKKMILTK
jgi:hypothetical protein